MLKKLTCVLVVLGIVALVLPACATDYYVKAGATGGKGTMEKPWKGIYKALAEVVGGDRIHVAQGIYSGKLKAGLLVIKTRDLTILGGYNDDFSERNPFKYLTVFQHDPESKASYNTNELIQTEGDHSNLVFDGFVLNGSTRNTYKANGDLDWSRSPQSPQLSVTSEGCKIRNCIVINSAHNGIRMRARGEGNVIENNFVLNYLDRGIDLGQAQDGAEAVVKNNTCAFGWTSGTREGYGVQIGAHGAIRLEQNLLMYQNEFGVNNGLKNDVCSAIGNCFFQNKGGHYRFWDEDTDQELVIDDPDDFEDANFEEAEDNFEADPGVKPNKEFFEKYSNQIQSEGGGKIVMDNVNALRQILGLSLMGTAGTGRKNFAPAYPYEDALLFATSDDCEGVGVQGGADFAAPEPAAGEGGEAAAAATKEYAEVDWQEIFDNYADYDGKAVAVKGGNGGRDMSAYYLEGVEKKDYICMKFRKPGGGTGDKLYVYIPHGSAAEKFYNSKKNKEFPYGEIKQLVVVSGTAKAFKAPAVKIHIAIIADEMAIAK